MQEYGYPDLEETKLKVFEAIDGNFPEIEEYETLINEQLIKWKKNLVEVYQNNYWMTFIDG